MNITILDDRQDTIRTPAVLLRRSPATTSRSGTITRRTSTRLAGRLKDTEALVLIRERTPIRAPLIERPRQAAAHQPGAACIRTSTSKRCTRRGIIVSRDTDPGRPSYATAELTWGSCIAAFRRHPAGDGGAQGRRAGRRSASASALRGKTLGIYGYGKIGAVVAGYGKAFGMNVLAWGRETRSPARRAKDGVRGRGEQEALFEQSDVVSLHLRLIDATRAASSPPPISRA